MPINSMIRIDLAIAVIVGSISLVGRQGLAGTVDIQADDHLEDGNRVLQVDRLIGCSGFCGGDGLARAGLESKFEQQG